MTRPTRTPSRRGLVIGTGGSLGYAWAVAALSTWQQATGLDARDADVVVGTSAGSIIASALVSGLAVDDLVDHLLDPPPRPPSSGEVPSPAPRGPRRDCRRCPGWAPARCGCSAGSRGPPDGSRRSPSPRRSCRSAGPTRPAS